MKRITQRDLQNMYEPVPKHLADGVDRILSSLDDREERPIVKKKISVSFVLAAVLIIASMAALAAGNLNLFRDMVNMANPILPLEGAEEMIETDLGSVENEYVTVTVEEAIYDGQSVMTLVHITPKDTEKYAMLNAFLQETPEKIYNTETRPVKAPEGGSSWEMDGNQYEFVNENGVVSFKVNGEETELPADLKTAEDMGLPMYLENGDLYYADQFEFAVTDRKDDREMIDWWAGMIIVDENAENAEELGEGYESSHTMDAEEQPDGSVLVWSDRSAEHSMPDTIKIKVKSGITVEGQEIAMDDLVFEISKAETEKKVTLIPEDGRINDCIEVLSAEISLTKVRGYLTVDYTYDPEDEEQMGIFMHLRDGDGNPINSGSGWTKELEDNHYRELLEVQAFEDLPGTFTIEAKAIDGDVIGRCVCRIVKEN